MGDQQGSESSEYVTGSDSDTEEDVTIPKEFQENVIKFVRIDNKVRNLKETIKELEGEKKEEAIIEYLDKIEKGSIDVNDGKLIINRSETQGTITRNIIKQVLKEMVDDPVHAAKMLERMDSLRETKVRTYLKRTFNRDTDNGKSTSTSTSINKSKSKGTDQDTDADTDSYKKSKYKPKAQIKSQSK